MVYLLNGKDSFRALEFVKSIFKGRRYKRIAFEDFSFKDIISEFSSDSLFVDISEQEHFFIRGDKLDEEFVVPKSALYDKKKIIVFYFERINADVIKKIIGGYDRSIKIKTFNPLKGEFIQKYIENYLKDSKIRFEAGVPKILGDFCKGDLWKMTTEVNAVIAKKGVTEISLADLYHLIGYSLEQNAFAIVDSVYAGKINKSLKILNDLMQKQEEDEFRIVGAINWQIKNILIVKDLFLRKLSIPVIQKVSGLKYFVAKKSLEQSSRYDLKALFKFHSNIVKLHLNLRRLKIAPQVLIEKFIYSLK